MNEAARANFMATQEGRRVGDDFTRQRRRATPTSSCWNSTSNSPSRKRTRDSYERSFRLFDDQHVAGLASKLEVSRAKLALRSVAATIPDIERQIALKENEINVLLGRNPGPIRPHRNTARSGIASGNSRGPALDSARAPARHSRGRAAEFAQANAEIGVAVGDFFPRVGLTTFYGGASTELTIS